MTPALPIRIGQITKRKDIFGNPMVYKVLDEISLIPKDNSQKAIYLQRLEFEPDKRVELRLCYYMIAQKGPHKGKWWFAQFAPMISKDDFDILLVQARKKGWLS